MIALVAAAIASFIAGFVAAILTVRRMDGDFSDAQDAVEADRPRAHPGAE